MKKLSKLQVIALRRKAAFFVPETKEDKVDNITFGAFLKVLNNYGFYLDINDEKVREAFVDKLITKDVLVSVKEAMSHAFDIPKDRVVLYANFPEQVENTSELELFVDAIIYALTGFNYIPGENDEYKRLAENYVSDKAMRSLTIINKEDMIDLFWSIAASKTALSETDKSDMDTILSAYTEEVVALAPEKEIPFKETMAKLVVQFNQAGLDISGMMKTPTDLLRVLQYLAEEKTDLKGKFKLPKFTNNVKDLISLALNSMRFNVEDVMRYKEEWKHIFRFCNCGGVDDKYSEYLYRSKKFKNFYALEVELFNEIHDAHGENKFTFTVDASEDTVVLENKKTGLEKYLDHLMSRPSELLRRVDKVARLGLSKSDLELLSDYIEKAVALSERRISYQLLNHLARRDEARGVFYRGTFNKLENHEPLDEDVEVAIKNAIRNGLKESFKQEEVVHVKRPNFLSMVPVVTSNRYASESFQGLVQGTKFNLPEGTDFIRLFSHWGKELGDVDLSAVALDSNMNIVSTCAYYELKSKGMNHSGDIRRGPGKEFIDVEIDTMRKRGAKYLLVQNYLYAGLYGETGLESLQTGVSILRKENRQKGAIHKSDEVLLSSSLTTQVSSVLSFVVNLEEMSVLWCDVPNDVGRYSNFHTSGNKFIEMFNYYNADTLKVQDILDLMHEVGVLIYEDELALDEGEEKPEVLILEEEQEDGVFFTQHDLIKKLIE